MTPDEAKKAITDGYPMNVRGLSASDGGVIHEGVLIAMTDEPTGVIELKFPPRTVSLPLRLIEPIPTHEPTPNELAVVEAVLDRGEGEFVDTLVYRWHDTCQAFGWTYEAHPESCVSDGEIVRLRPKGKR